jgi:8-oxo-dGTP pyrophosphatase MutT (NUDIX family)
MPNIHKNLLEKLAIYKKKHPQESKITDKFIDFVFSNPNCFSRRLEAGHLTTSCFLVGKEQSSCLLLHHKKLNKWLQPGGHLDGQSPQEAILKEIKEETGLQEVDFLQNEIFDLDIHFIAPYKDTKKHYHYDIRFLIGAKTENIKKNHESKAICWVQFDKLSKYTTERSILRMLQKFLNAEKL